MRLWLGGFVSLGLFAFAACGSDSAEDSKENPDAGAAVDASSGSSSSGTVTRDSGSGPFSEEEQLPCEGRTANDAFSVYVAATGADTPTCGTREEPCKTVQKGITTAYEIQKPKVLVGAGTYVEAIVLDGGLTVEGAWDVAGTTWTASCGSGYTSRATIQAPDDANTSVRATRGASVLRFLTIKSKPAAAPGESLYGLIAIGPNVKVALADSELVVAAGGDGAVGAAGVGTSAQQCLAGDDGANGTPGDPGPPGAAGTLGGDGFTPGAGGDGSTGEGGHVGTKGSDAPIVNFDYCDATCKKTSGSVMGTSGTAGCGGGGGQGGKGGVGGGSSVGILAVNAMIVTYGGSVTTGAGGRGGEGGPGAAGVIGDPGTAGTDVAYAKAIDGVCESPDHCSNNPDHAPGGVAGGNGGTGGNGGQGGGGAGGWSIGFAKLDGAAILTSATTLFTTGEAGKGGAPNGPEGLRQQQWP